MSATARAASVAPATAMPMLAYNDILVPVSVYCISLYLYHTLTQTHTHLPEGGGVVDPVARHPDLYLILVLDGVNDLELVFGSDLCKAIPVEDQLVPLVRSGPVWVRFTCLCVCVCV